MRLRERLLSLHWLKSYALNNSRMWFTRRLGYIAGQITASAAASQFLERIRLIKDGKVGFGDEAHDLDEVVAELHQ
ncbi:hypothetical protein CC78DRAFT_587067 [Lojkania enalia]|uniref:Uncharacterized protein n=1 Tax=Lojkania enalia TaxID=147567 RepID=A0A9P4K1J7_9PLEO|nr:hypothetical protein CC78DRAFT_587067 [Didymosphaeria enalia]